RHKNVTYLSELLNTAILILNAMIKYRNVRSTYEKKLQWHRYIEKNYDWKIISKELYNKIVMISKAKKMNIEYGL
ncbi:MAG: hypothetical protein ACP5R3_06650, partial [Thermoplasmata archaeon]